MNKLHSNVSWQEARSALLLEMCEGIHRSICEGCTLLDAVNAARRKFNGMYLGHGRVLAASRASIHRAWYAWRKYRSKQAFSLRYQDGSRSRPTGSHGAQHSLVMEWLDERLPKEALIPIVHASVACGVDPKRIHQWMESDGLEAVNAGTERNPDWLVHRVSLLELWKRKVVHNRPTEKKRSTKAASKRLKSMGRKHV
jgi:hypothetical protein